MKLKITGEVVGDIADSVIAEIIVDLKQSVVQITIDNNGLHADITVDDKQWYLVKESIRYELINA